MIANKFKGEVDASEFGAGFTIQLDMDGHGKIEGQYGIKPAEIGQALFDMQNGLALLSTHYIKLFLSVSLRGKSGAVVEELPPMPKTSMDAIGKKCLDAFALFRYGKTHEEWIADNAKKAKEDPPENPTKGTKA